MKFYTILAETKEYYDEKLKAHGAIPQGVDWNSWESQELRFEQLLKVCDQSTSFTINDYGCGYGALAGHLKRRGYVFLYNGFDISEQMIDAAREQYGNHEQCRFVADESCLTACEYTVASGIFNVKLQTNDEEWNRYMLHTLEKMSQLSTKGFAFNVLTKYSDPEHMQKYLFYSDPLYLFDYCKRNFSGYVALLHDYPLFEFTILVKK